jgi:hypothetical protein
MVNWSSFPLAVDSDIWSIGLAFHWVGCHTAHKIHRLSTEWPHPLVMCLPPGLPLPYDRMPYQIGYDIVGGNMPSHANRGPKAILLGYNWKPFNRLNLKSYYWQTCIIGLNYHWRAWMNCTYAVSYVCAINHEYNDIKPNQIILCIQGRPKLHFSSWSVRELAVFPLHVYATSIAGIGCHLESSRVMG